MEQSELVMDIVFSLDTTFTDLTKDECQNIFHIFPSYRYLHSNKNIQNAFNKYFTLYIYNELYNYLMNNYYELYNSNMKMKMNSEKIQEIIDKIPNTEIKDCFDRLVIAEYKEQFYLKKDKYTSYGLKLIESFIDYYYPISDDYSNDIIYNHKHDPSHYMFVNDSEYEFYYYEKAGNNLFD